MISAIYSGRVLHSRSRPVRHSLHYRMLNLLLDIDELPSLSARLRLFGHNRRAVFSFHDRDHGDGSARPLAAQLRAALADAGIAADGPIQVLCMPRLLGMVFNPLTVYFCNSRDGRLAAILYEVNNTFGQRHSYLMPVDQPDARPILQACDKHFYVSPFMDMDLQYRFRVMPPSDSLSVTIDVSDPTGPLLHAAFAATRAELTDAALLRAFLAHPLLALRVFGGIHWEALKLWRKGMKLRPRPTPPAAPISFGTQGDLR